MEKEILDFFAAAKKAGEAAAADGGPAEISRCLDALKELRKLPMTTKELVSTKVGKGILCLTKHPHQKIQAAASELRQHWKNLVIHEASSKNTSTDSPTSEAVTVSPATERSNKSALPNGKQPEKPNRNLQKVPNLPTSLTPSPKLSSPTPSKPLSTLPPKRSSPPPPPKLSSPTPPKQSSLPAPPKLSAMVKCNDEARDKVREMLAEALARVSGEVTAELKSEAAAADPIRVAVAVECRMFEKLGKSTGTQKARYRSILFNMRDSKNPDLRRRVLLGQVTAAELVDMPAEDMASDDRKRQNQQIKDKAIFECERGGPAKATTDQFKCGRCGKRKTTYYQLQTRSADEPMTTFVTCVECNNHWKFC